MDAARHGRPHPEGNYPAGYDPRTKAFVPAYAKRVKREWTILLGFALLLLAIAVAFA